MRAVVGRLAALLAACALLTGCTVQVAGVAAPDPRARVATTGPAAPPGYVDPGGRFGITAPPGWAADTTGAQGTAVVFRDPSPTRSDVGDFTANVNVLVVRSPADLPATVVGARSELRSLGAYTPTTDEAAALGDGTPAHLLGGTFVDPGSGARLRNLQLFTVHDGATTVVTGTAPAASWAAYADVFDTALRTLTVAG